MSEPTRARAAKSARRLAPAPLEVLLVGPCPPPHGGISVHVATARELLRRESVRCRVLDSGGHRARGGAFAAAASFARLLAGIDAHARRGYTLHLHTNGHSAASWGVALACAIAARTAPGRVLTLHSGLLPDYLDRAGIGARWLERATVKRYQRIVCVHQRIHDSLIATGSDRERLVILPAHLVTPQVATGLQKEAPALPEDVERWIASRSPIVSTALFFRPEYGFELLLEAMVRLAERHPGVGCVVMGGGAGKAGVSAGRAGARDADSGIAFDEVAAARRRVTELGLADRVLLTGDLSHECCLAVMARSDAFARPALQDGDAISVREALALGVPAVASDVSERPPGTVLHRTGDAADLAARLDAVLEALPGVTVRPPEPQRQNGEGGIDPLLWIYRQVRGEGAAAAVESRGRLTSRLARLRQMSAREVGFRLRHALRAEVDRRTPPADREESHRSLLEASGAAHGSFLRHLREEVAPHFYLPARIGDRRALAELLWRRFPTWLSATAAEAERLCEHRMTVLGHGEVDLGAEIDWHRDPVSGAVWPRRHFASYDPVREPSADAKVVCEINRHQHLPRLGKAYMLLGEERYAREVVAQMLSWIDQNPRSIGLHWHSSLEIAIRALSWMWALFYVLPSPALDEAAALRIGKSLHAQLDHVARYPSVYSSPNTHLLGEATALFVGGLLFSGGPRGRRWLQMGTTWLEREAEHQVLDDGVHAELSPYYHCYAIDFYLQALVLARRCSHPLNLVIWSRVERMLDALLQLASPDLALPLLGDDDGGRALALGSTTHYADASDLLCAGAALYGRGDWKRQAGAFREEAMWLLGRDGWTAWEGLAPAEPTAVRASYADAGYVVERAGWSRSSSHLVFDRGDLGKLGGGHGHADALSIVLSAGGHPLLVDSGTGVYNAAPEWRSFFRSSRAHNTLTVDGVEQSAQADTFRWKSQASSNALGDGSYPGIHYAAGEHDGYAASLGLTHRRRVLSIETGYWLVLDDIRALASAGGAAHAARGDAGAGGGRHQMQLFWHFAPEALVTLGSDDRPARGAAAEAANGGAWVSARDGVKAVGRVATTGVASGLTIQMQASGRLDARVVTGAIAPPQGWVSRRYGEKSPAPVLEARFSARAPAVCATLLAPWSESQRARLGAEARPLAVRIVEDGDGATATSAAAVALTIPHARGEDVVVLASRGALVEAGPCRARAEVLWLRLEDDRPALLLALDASMVELRGERVLASEQPVHHFWSAARSRTQAPYLVEELQHVRHRRDR